MKIVHVEGFSVDIGPHVFPIQKYELIRARLLAAGLVAEDDFTIPEAASWDDLALVHTPAWLAKLREQRLSIADTAKLELAAPPQTVEGFRLMCGGTILAARLAPAHGIALAIGGGFHHAFPDHGEGFCMFNDVAVAVRVLQREGVIRRAAIVDLDVHHGNGTAAIFAGDPDVFTFSMHQWNNYPAEKPPSTLDVHLHDGADDGMYLRELQAALPEVVAHRPDLVMYLGGADPYHDDQLGGLSLSLDGLRLRDRLVFDTMRRAGLPVAVTLAGGYARRTDDTVAIHVATIAEAAAALGRAA